MIRLAKAIAAFTFGHARALGFPLAAFAAALLGLAFAAAPAQGAVAWIHKEKLGSVAEPTFTRASKMAIDGSGRIYVIDAETSVSWGLKRFHPDGTPANFSALGTNVIDGKRSGGVNECPAVPADCDETPDGKTASSIFDTVAIDRSGGATDGNVYVSDFFGRTVDIFSSAGVHIGQLTASSKGPLGAGETGRVRAVGVDEAGNVFVSDEAQDTVGPNPQGDWIHRYEPTGAVPVNADNVASFSITLPRSLVAGVGPSDGYLFAVEGNGRKRDSQTGAVQYIFSLSSGEVLTVDPVTGHVFTAAGNKALEWDLSGPEAPAAAIAEVQDAGSSVNGLAVADDAGSIGALLYLTGFFQTKVDVYEKAVIPEAEIGPPVAVSGAKAKVSGAVRPDGVEVGECFFQYGKTTSYGQTAPCTEFEEGGVWKPLADPDELGSGTDPVPVRGELSGLLANGNTYHYRLVVRGASGGEFASGDGKVTTAETFTADPATTVTQTEATLRGTAKPEGVALSANCFFEWGPSPFYGQTAPCVPNVSGAAGEAGIAVSAPISGLEPSAFYHYRLVAANALGQIVSADRTLFTQGKPRIFEQTPIEVTQSAATLQARINPAGSPTSYRFEWATEAEFQAEGKYPNRIPLETDASAGDGSEPVRVQERLEGLEVAGRYHFRIVATNSFGTSEGPDQPFQTLGSNGLPDNRAFELVTPADKGPAAMIADSFSRTQVTQASEDGDSFMYPLLNGLDDSTSGAWLRYMATREDSGWLSAQVSAPALIAPSGFKPFGIAQPSMVRFATPDNGCALLESYNPLTSDTPPQGEQFGVENLYRWSVGEGEVAQRSTGPGGIQYRPAQEDEGGYTLISNRLPLNPEAPSAFDSAYYAHVEASDDCEVVYFRTGYQLIKGASGLYEWDGGALRDAGVLPNGAAGAGVLLGAETFGGASSARPNAVSPDGSRMFFTATANQGPSLGTAAVFMREDGGDRVVEISKSKTAVPSKGARFEAASPDGSRVVFRANYGISPSSSSGPINQACGPRSGETVQETNISLEQKPCDLYLYDVASEALSNISADANPGIGAQVQGTVAIDEDASHVYFAALGQLIAGKGRTYAQNTAGGGSANVYLRRAGEPLAYVATLSSGDLLGFAGGLMRRVRDSRAATTPDGSRLLFASARNLTNYESGGSQKLAAYLYSAASGELACLSCRPDGLPLSAEDIPAKVGQGADHQSRWLLPQPQSDFTFYRPRALSEDGHRVIFTSPDALATGAEEGRRNVYQWQQGQVSFLAIAEGGGVNGLAGYQGMSVEGDDVFLAAAERLAPHDSDFVSDVYAVRVEGGIPYEEEPPECQVDEAVALLPNQIYCQGDPSPRPSAPDAASSDFTGPGNVKEAPGPKPCGKGKVRRAKRCLAKGALARRACAKRKGKAKRRCVASQMRRLNRLQQRQGRAANSDRGGSR